MTATMVEALAAADPARVLLDCDGRLVGVGEVQEASGRIAGALSSLGIEPGDRVALMMRNVPEFVHAWFGILRHGALEVPVHADYRGAMLAHVLAESGARVLMCDAEFVPRLDGLDVPALESLVVRGAHDSRRPSVPFEEALAHAPAPADHPAARRDASCILYTSGTTGPAKGVVLSHAANLHLARANVELMGYGAGDVLYTAFPLFHVNAKFTSVTSALLTGARLVLDDRFSASGFWPRMREKGVTAFNYMGAMLTILHKQPVRADDADNPVTRAYGAAGPAAIFEDFERRFDVELREHYGMTEIGIATMNTAEARRVGSCGRAAPYYEVRVAGDDDVEVPDGEVGEIQVRPRVPDIVMTAYWRRPDATLEAFRNLWFHTGDLGRRDADGFFTFVDRTKDSIRRRGENISSWEVETAVNMHPAVLESGAYGLPSELGEDDVAVAVVLKPGAELDPAALVDFCREELPRFAVPRYVTFLDELPKTPSQRVQKFRLRAQGVEATTFDASAVASA